MSWILESLLVGNPSLVQAVVAIVEDDVSVVSVGTTVDVKALLTEVPDVLSRSSVPLNSLVLLSFPCSDDCRNINPELRSLLVGNGVSSHSPSSDGLCSRVEDEPLPVVFRVVVSDSESELFSSDVLTPEDCS